MTITFRPITVADIPTLHRWRNLPHVSRWWHPSNPSLQLANEEYRHYLQPGSGVDAYITLLDGREMGYIQMWWVRHYPDYKPYVPVTDDMVGVDVFIGEPDYLHRGVGPRIMRRFLCDYVFSHPHVPAAIIDPLPENAAAIRAYEKAGFKHEKTFTHDGAGVYFMRLPRADMDCTTTS
jgi:RimJ/RimL family protein N-acetyltransferase